MKLRWVFSMVLVTAAASARADETCPPMEQTIGAIVAGQSHDRADVTGDLACHFPLGMSFNDAAILLDRNRFDMLNETEQSFWIWNVRGEEFVAKRFVATRMGSSEIRVTIHIDNKKLTRFAAQVLSVRK